jgi:hypothetical protein
MHFTLTPSARPSNFRICRALGLGTRERPCPFATCKHSLICDSTPDNKVHMAFPIDEIHDHETCSLRVAARGETPPVAIARMLGISLGLAELVQRHALAKVETALGRVKDLKRKVTLNIDGVLDARKQPTKRAPRIRTRATRRPAPPESPGSTVDMRLQLDAYVARLRAGEGKRWRSVPREEVERLYGDRLHPDFGRPRQRTDGFEGSWRRCGATVRAKGRKPQGNRGPGGKRIRTDRTGTRERATLRASRFFLD